MNKKRKPRRNNELCRAGRNLVGGIVEAAEICNVPESLVEQWIERKKIDGIFEAYQLYRVTSIDGLIDNLFFHMKPSPSEERGFFDSLLPESEEEELWELQALYDQLEEDHKSVPEDIDDWLFDLDVDEDELSYKIITYAFRPFQISAKIGLQKNNNY